MQYSLKNKKKPNFSLSCLKQTTIEIASILYSVLYFSAELADKATVDYDVMIYSINTLYVMQGGRQ